MILCYDTDIEFAGWQIILKKGGDAMLETRKGESHEAQKWVGKYLVSIFRIGG
ncbi:hypothetical protein ACFLWR_06810 [Chloroflexota bacterium]